MVSDTKLLSIGQVARRAGLTVRALRHYDEIGLLPPHDVDPDTGYRRYTNEQVERAATIRTLRELDVPVETIRSFLDATDAAAAAQVISAHLTNVDARAWRLHGIQHRLRMMIEEGATMATDGRTDAGANDDVERALAMDLFNETWTLLETEDRTHDQAERMVHAAHASRYHWEQVGGPEQLVVGDWQISRVYSVLGRPEPALHHAHEAWPAPKAPTCRPGSSRQRMRPWLEHRVWPARTTKRVTTPIAHGRSRPRSMMRRTARS